MLCNGVFACLCCLIATFQLISALPTTQTIRRRRAAATTECGSALERTFNKRIFNGIDAELGYWPWMAALIDKKQGQFCGGTLVKDQFILTAAHCVKNHDPKDIIVSLGLMKLSKPNKEAVNYTVKSIINHENYNRRQLLNDIAILKLNQNVQLSPIIHSACLPSKALSPEEKVAYVTGWGRTSKGPSSDILQEVSFAIWKNENCSKTLGVQLTDSQLCAGTEDGSKDSCKGDSGGPLVINIGGKWIISGIVSGALNECGKAGNPGVYTKVSSFNNWIKEAIYSNLRIGCPDGFKNFDEFTCVNEYYLNQFKSGQLTWDQLLERRQKIARLLPTRTSNVKCPGGFVEFDEFNCLSTFLYERYQSKKESWNNLINYLKNKAVLVSRSSSVVSGPTVAPSVTPPKFAVDGIREIIRRVSCDTTSASKQGLAQHKFDEVHCISPEYITGFRRGDFDWYELLLKRFEKKS